MTSDQPDLSTEQDGPSQEEAVAIIRRGMQTSRRLSRRRDLKAAIPLLAISLPLAFAPSVALPVLGLTAAAVGAALWLSARSRREQSPVAQALLAEPHRLAKVDVLPSVLSFRFGSQPSSALRSDTPCQVAISLVRGKRQRFLLPSSEVPAFLAAVSARAPQTRLAPAEHPRLPSARIARRK